MCIPRRWRGVACARVLAGSMIWALASTCFGAPGPGGPSPKVQVKSGFKAEVVASAPIVGNPVAISFDEDGRLYVAELVARGAVSGGRLRVLDGQDETGVFTSSAIITEDLPRVTSLVCFRGGLFVSAGTEILYVKPAGGSGTNTSTRSVVFQGFGGANPPSIAEGFVRGLEWGPDGRIYGGTAGYDSEVSSPNGQAVVRLFNMGFSFDPLSLSIRPETGSAEWGVTFDTTGRRYLIDLQRPLRAVVYDYEHVLRNPFVPWVEPMNDVLSPATQLYAIADGPADNRAGAGQRITNTTITVPGSISRARGGVIYRGSAFPSNYLNNAFIPVPDLRLVHRAVIREAGLQPVASRAPDELKTEFIRSADDAFRPMHVINGPEGGLYIADVGNAPEQGRIYRITLAAAKPGKTPRLRNLGTRDLVALLSHPNGWHRDAGSRLLLERHDQAAGPLLSNVLTHSRVPLARVHALRALGNLRASSPALVLAALKDLDEQVRLAALKTIDSLAVEKDLTDPILSQMRALTSDRSLRLRYELAYASSKARNPERVAFLAELLVKDIAQPAMRMAVLSSLISGGGEMFAVLARTPAFRAAPVGQQFLDELTQMIGLSGNLEEVGRVIAFMNSANLEPATAFSLVAALGEGLHRAGSSLANVDPIDSLRPYYVQALDAAVSSGAAVNLRLAAIRLLGVSPLTFIDQGDWLLAMAGSREPPAIVNASLIVLGRFDEPRIESDLVRLLPGLTAVSRQQAISSLFFRENRIPAGLSALNAGRFGTGEVPPSLQTYLRMHPDRTVQQTAQRLFGPTVIQRPAVLESFLPALKLSGSAGGGASTYQSRCMACHPLGNDARVGSGLAAARRKSKPELLRDIIEPGVEVASGSTLHSLRTKAGETYLGTLSLRTPDSVVLEQGTNRVAWALYAVQAIDSIPGSAMPNGLEQGLSVQAMADLIAFIQQ